jgi:hypothetical protein
MADWEQISSLATGGGTLVLALATFASVRSSNRTARVAERSLLAAQRPVLTPSREEDADERIMYGDQHWVTLTGHGAIFEFANDVVYLALPLRNIGAGIAVIHGWIAAAEGIASGGDRAAPELDRFRRQSRDLYVASGEPGFWQGALRDPEDPDHAPTAEAAQKGEPLFIYLLYGDHEGGQRTIARFSILPRDNGDGLVSSITRYWNVDRDDPR